MPSNHSFINVSRLLQSSNYDAQLAKKLLGLLMDSIREGKANIEHYYQQQQWEELINATHKLHGGSSYCGAYTLAGICSDIYPLANAEDHTALEEPIMALSHHIEELLNWGTTDNWDELLADRTNSGK